MYIEGFEQWSKLGKNFGTPFNELNKAVTDITKRVSEQNLALIEENFVRFTSQVKRFSNIRKPEDFLNLQRDIMTENINSGVETMQKIVRIAMDNMEEMSKIWGSTAAKISEKAVEKAQKYAEKKAERV